jgi:hypothetical protein
MATINAWCVPAREPTPSKMLSPIGDDTPSGSFDRYGFFRFQLTSRQMLEMSLPLNGGNWPCVASHTIDQTFWLRSVAVSRSRLLGIGGRAVGSTGAGWIVRSDPRPARPSRTITELLTGLVPEFSSQGVVPNRFATRLTVL